MILAALLLAAATPPAFQYCISCHSVDPAETGLPAPNLDGLVGRRAGSRADFEYSPAMQAAGGEFTAPEPVREKTKRGMPMARASCSAGSPSSPAARTP
jgi:hypothetical protein